MRIIFFIDCIGVAYDAAKDIIMRKNITSQDDNTTLTENNKVGQKRKKYK